jgi:hypothetical protein
MVYKDLSIAISQLPLVCQTVVHHYQHRDYAPGNTRIGMVYAVLPRGAKIWLLQVDFPPSTTQLRSLVVAVASLELLGLQFQLLYL